METAPPRILVADDNAGHRSAAATLLRRAGYHVELAADGPEMLEAVRGGDFRLVLLDIAMPGMEGLQAVRRIRDLPAPRGSVPMVAVTAHAMPGDRERLLAAGLDDYLSKPVAAGDLLSLVSRWLHRQDPAAGTGAEGEGAENLPAVDDGALERLAEQTDPAIVPSLVATYLAELNTRCGRIAEALSRQDWAMLQGQAHALKSASHSFGAARLATALEAIEAACLSGDTEAAGSLAADIPGLAEAVTEAFARRA